MKVIRGKKTDMKSGETHRVLRKSNLVAVGIIGLLGICMLSGCSLADKTKVEPCMQKSRILLNSEKVMWNKFLNCEVLK